ncbi:hypothetical protein O9X98_14455 [Agrobacterium salinitolerans]|nr:hypothetical protein [Agrobacterium salinitolerans]
MLEGHCHQAQQGTSDYGRAAAVDSGSDLPIPLISASHPRSFLTLPDAQIEERLDCFHHPVDVRCPCTALSNSPRSRASKQYQTSIGETLRFP